MEKANGYEPLALRKFCIRCRGAKRILCNGSLFFLVVQINQKTPKLADDFTTPPLLWMLPLIAIGDILMTDLPQTRGATARVISYLQQNPDAWTWQIARSCAVANVPDVAMKFNLRCAASNQPFRLCCAIHPTTNRFGKVIQAGRWRLTRTDQNADLAA